MLAKKTASERLAFARAIASRGPPLEAWRHFRISTAVDRHGQTQFGARGRGGRRSPESNGMVEAFVKTFKRDRVYPV